MGLKLQRRKLRMILKIILVEKITRKTKKLVLHHTHMKTKKNDLSLKNQE